GSDDEAALGTDVGTGRPDLYFVATGIKHTLTRCIVEVTQRLSRSETEGDVLRLSRLQGDPLEATQFLERPVTLRIEGAQIELHDLFAGAITFVAQRDSH